MEKDMQQPGLIIIPSHKGVQRHEAHTVMTQTGPCLGMLHSINKIALCLQICFITHGIIIFLHKCIRSTKYQNRNIDFPENALILDSFWINIINTLSVSHAVSDIFKCSHATQLFAFMILPLRFQSSESPDETEAAGTLRWVLHSQVVAMRSDTPAKIENE